MLARTPAWVRVAVVHAVTGTLLGLLTSVVLVVLSGTVFPRLADFDHDFGLRLQAFISERVTHRFSGLQPEDGTDRYLFLDVDPREAAPAAITDVGITNQLGSTGACAALAEAQPTRYVMSAERRDPNIEPATSATELNCGAERSVNRYLLAELIRKVRTLKPNLIVLDVRVGGNTGELDQAEAGELTKAIAESSEIPVIFAAPASFVARVPPQDVNLVHVEWPGRSSGGVPAVAFPAPDPVIRRFPKCYATDGIGARAVPSLPYMAASLFRSPLTAASDVCREHDPGGIEKLPFASPRITYTLPSLHAHQDAPGTGDEFRLWSFYRGVYNRCLAANVWRSDLECGRGSAYEGRVVVIGASNDRRRDNHATPLGTMVGAEVVINAIRSFVLHDESEPRLGEMAWKKAKIVLLCSPVWFAFFLFRGWLTNGKRSVAVLQRLMTRVVVLALFCVTLVIVVTIAAAKTYASFTVFIAVLAIAVEQYIEAVHAVLHPVDKRLRRFLQVEHQ